MSIIEEIHNLELEIQNTIYETQNRELEHRKAMGEFNDDEKGYLEEKLRILEEQLGIQETIQLSQEEINQLEAIGITLESPEEEIKRALDMLGIEMAERVELPVELQMELEEERKALLDELARIENEQNQDELEHRKNMGEFDDNEEEYIRLKLELLEEELEISKEINEPIEEQWEIEEEIRNLLREQNEEYAIVTGKLQF